MNRKLETENSHLQNKVIELNKKLSCTQRHTLGDKILMESIDVATLNKPKDITYDPADQSTGQI